MSVLSRAALEESPLADLHTIAGELGLDGYRRLRKADLIGRILERAGGDTADGAEPESVIDEPPAVVDDEAGEERDERPRPRRGRRGGRRASGARDADPGDGDGAEAEADADVDVQAPTRPPRARRARRDSGAGAESTVDGVVELAGNGSGFVRVAPPESSDDDVYVSAAQVRRCELVSGDRVSGPVRAPRRSERYPSLIRVDTINGRPADEVAEGTHFDDLPCAFPTERLSLGADDATLKAIEWLTPIGRGSRVTITGQARAGKSETLRRLAGALVAQEDLEVTVVLAGARPEEVALWSAEAGVTPSATVALGASPELQAQAIDRVIDTARRVAARGAHAVVLIDTIEGLAPAAARRALAAARNIVDGGSLTIVATATEPVGGETTVVALDVTLTSTGRFPAVDLVASGTLRPELLVGQAGADAIAQARATAREQ